MCKLLHIFFNFSRENEEGKSLHSLLIIRFPEKKKKQDHTSVNGHDLQLIARIKKFKQYYTKKVFLSVSDIEIQLPVLGWTPK